MSVPAFTNSFSRARRWSFNDFQPSFNQYMKVAPSGGFSPTKKRAPCSALPEPPIGEAGMYSTASRTGSSVPSAARLASDASARTGARSSRT